MRISDSKHSVWCFPCQHIQSTVLRDMVQCIVMVHKIILLSSCYRLRTGVQIINVPAMALMKSVPGLDLFAIFRFVLIYVLAPPSHALSTMILVCSIDFLEFAHYTWLIQYSPSIDEERFDVFLLVIFLGDLYFYVLVAIMISLKQQIIPEP